MESGLQSSFIPKDAGKATAAPRLERGGGLADLLLLISIVLLVASAALAGAVFLYQQYLTTESTSKVAQLKTAESAFDPALIQQVTRLDDRMRIADQVLGAHIAPTALLVALGQSTLQTISFSSFDLEAQDPTKITIKMQGVAARVNSIALEADLLSKNGVFTNPIFTGITRQQDGVHFDLSALVNPSAINYVSLISAAAAQAGAQPAQQNSPFSGSGPSDQTTTPGGTPATSTPQGLSTPPATSTSTGTGATNAVITPPPQN